MPILVDGNNLMYALRKAGFDVDRAGVATLLSELTKSKERVCVIFDGPMPRSGASELAAGKLEILYSIYRKADELVLERIAANTAPRRLLVVSTDREIRKAAQHRSCQSVTSEEFVPLLFGMIERAHRKRLREPQEKQQGLTEEQTRQWLRELGLNEETGEEQ